MTFSEMTVEQLEAVKAAMESKRDEAAAAVAAWHAESLREPARLEALIDGSVEWPTSEQPDVANRDKALADACIRAASDRIAYLLAHAG